MTQSEQEILDGINAQFDFSVKYVNEIVDNLVKDTTLATQVKDAVASKLGNQKTLFANAAKAEDEEVDLTSELS